MPERSTDQLARDLENQAKTITELVIAVRAANEEIAKLKTSTAVKDAEDKYRDEKLDGFSSLQKVAVGAIVSLFIGAIFAALKAGVFNVG